MLKTITDKKTFEQLRKSSNSAGSHNVIVAYLEQENLRFGLTVSKKVGSAVIRNRAKRQLREIIRAILKDEQAASKLPLGAYSIIARNNITKAKFNEIERDLRYCLRKITKGLETSKGLSNKGLQE